MTAVYHQIGVFIEGLYILGHEDFKKGLLKVLIAEDFLNRFNSQLLIRSSDEEVYL